MARRPRAQYRHSRKVNTRQPRRTILVVCEGVDEVFYLGAFKQKHDLPHVHLEPKQAKHATPASIIRTALQEAQRKDYDVIYCVFDGDRIQENQVQFNQALQEAKKAKLKMQRIISTPCLELWFLLHYQYTTKSFSQCGDVEKELKHHLPDYEKRRNYPVYSKLSDKLETAIRHAKQLENHNQSQQPPYTPHTDMHKLIMAILEKE